MQSHSENTKRIAKNTLMLYGRMLFSMVVSLYTSRVILNALGVVDYGIFSVVGGFVSMFSLISSSLSSAVSRYLTFELGRGDKERLTKAFSTSLLIHVCLAIIVLFTAETLGVWFVNNKMTIPANRIYAANWVFQTSVLSFLFGILRVPYNASIISHEKMSVFAYMGILDTTLKLVIVLLVAHNHWEFDNLIVYSVLLLVISIVLLILCLWYCLSHFEECNLRIDFNKEFWREISSFSLWSFIGCAAGILKDQGVNVLFNTLVGPVLNAARGIAGSVNNAVSSFAGNFMTALNPQITKSYATGDKQYTYYLVERGSRFSFYILLFLAIPILLETDFILTIWLKQWPEHSSNFVRLILLLSMIDSLSNTLITLQNATGRIRNYQLVVGTILLLNFPLSYICLKVGLEPESTYVVALIIAVMCLMVRLLFVRKSAHLPLKNYMKNVVLNVSMVGVVALLIPSALHILMPYGLGRLLVVISASIISTTLSIFFVGCTNGERSFITDKMISIILKYRK